jgi:hypothetical protein
MRACGATRRRPAEREQKSTCADDEQARHPNRLARPYYSYVRIRLGAAAALAALVATGGLLATVSARGGQAAVSSTLNAGFDADGNIYLTFADGTKIGNASPPGTVIPTGTYTIVLSNNSLDDLGNPHSFRLTGPGVSLAANGVVQATWTATFQASSTYVYSDDDNASAKYYFGTPGSGATSTVPTVNTTSTPPTTTGTTPKATSNSPFATKTSSTSSKFRGTLLATVKAGKLTLTDNGKPVTSLLFGRYKITVTDASPSAGFTIQKTGQPGTTITGVAYVGKHSATLTLGAGQWFFYPSFVGHKTYFIVER